MGSVGEILNLMHQFTPKGQKMVMSLLRENKGALRRPFAYLDLPSYLAKHEQLGLIEREMTGTRYLSENMHITFNKWCCENGLNYDFSFGMFRDRVIRYAENIERNNKIKPIVKNRDKVIEFVETRLKDTKLAEEFRTASTPEEIETSLNKLLEQHLLPQTTPEMMRGMRQEKKLEYFQQAWKDFTTKSDMVLDFYKQVLTPSNDPEVVKIVEYLKSQYGLKYLHFENPADAKKMLEAVTYAKQKGIPIPDNILMSPSISIADKNIITTNLETTVLINPKQLNVIMKDAMANDLSPYAQIFGAEITSLENIHNSTPHELHAIMHEFNHSRNLLPISPVHIKSEHIPTVGGLMEQSRNNFNFLNDEIRNELITKRDIQGLNKHEKRLLRIWE